MARDYITIGPSPGEEECAQVGAPDYYPRMREETARFILLIRQKLGQEPEGAYLAVKSFPHDFGTYHEVVCYFDDTSEEATKYAYKCESEAPLRWESQSSRAKPEPAVCNSCLAAAYDMGISNPQDQATLMLEMGADVEDHLCDARVVPKLSLTCLCACQRR